MREVAVMAGAGVVSSFAVAAWVDPSARPEVLLGMIGPLLAAAVSWVVAERAYRLHSETLTRVMTAAFGAKVLFFAMYVALMMRVIGLSLVPFAASFFGYFIALYAIEALYFRRLFR